MNMIETVLKEGDNVWAGAFRPSAWPGRTSGSAKVGSGMLDEKQMGIILGSLTKIEYQQEL
jgi:hypothetical protein